MPRMRWRRFAPDPAGGAHDAPPDLLVGSGGGVPQEPHASQRLDPRAFSARCSAPRF